MKIARPSPKNSLIGNANAFASTGLGLLSWKLCSQPDVHMFHLLLGGLIGVGTIKLSYRATIAFYKDFDARRGWIKALRPSAEKVSGRFSTYEEMADVGMYEPRGRILGTDFEGRLLFEPHKLNPTFSYFHGPQGSAKTTSRVFSSILLTPLFARRK